MRYLTYRDNLNNLLNAKVKSFFANHFESINEICPLLEPLYWNDLKEKKSTPDLEKVYLKIEKEVYILPHSYEMAFILPQTKGILPAFIESLMTASSNDFQRVKTKVIAALEIISEYSPLNYDIVRNHTRWIVPLHQLFNTSKLNFTHDGFLGAIFLNDLGSEVSFAEALVHESLHSELYKLNYSFPIFKKKFENLHVFSPWRNEKRPIEMVFHGIFVFYGVFNLYMDLISHNVVKDTHRLLFIKDKIEEAISILNHQYLNEWYEQLIQEIKIDVNEKCTNLF